jgi:CRISPR-associated exonuclease Cas4
MTGGNLGAQEPVAAVAERRPTFRRRCGFAAIAAEIIPNVLHGEAPGVALILETHAEHLEVVGAGARRGVILYKLMEDLLTGELAGEFDASVSRARELLDQLVSDVNDDEPRPDPNEMAAAALRGLALPEIAELRPYLVPEIAIWGRDEVGLLAGRADALAIIEERVDAAIDWKSDANPTPAVRKAHVQQLHEYLSATGAVRGAIVYLTSGEVTWILRS